MDLSLYKALNGLAYHHDAFEDVMRFFATSGIALYAPLLLGLFLARGRWRSVEGRRGVALAGFAALLALGVAQLVSHAVDRVRPYVAHPHVSHLFMPASHDASFPSDHATGSFAIAMAIWLRHRVAGTVAFLLAFVISAGRVAVGTHYPTDVVAGAVLGCLAATLLYLLPTRRLIDAIADAVGRVWDRATAGVLPTRSRARA